MTQKELAALPKLRQREGQNIYYMPNGQIHVESVNNEPSMTQQQFADECDINKIVAAYLRNPEQLIMNLNRKEGVYADLSNIPDYQGMLDQTLKAQEAFMTLPPKIRSRFHNDPQELINFLGDSSNIEEGIKLGLLDPIKESEPTPTPTP